MLKRIFRDLLADLRTTVSDLDMRTTLVLLATPVLLCWLWFFGGVDRYIEWFGLPRSGGLAGPRGLLLPWVWWGGNCFLAFFVVPAAIVVFVFKRSLRDFGITMPAPGKQVPLALLLYLLVLPFVIGASRAVTFQRTYPLFHGADLALTTFVAWEAIYLLQFFSLEFFFRGFMVLGLAPRFGAASVLVSTVPYCMIHFTKPPAEAYAAIVAGLVLGTVSLRTRSIWSGFMVHGLVAITMDLLAAWAHHHPT